MVRFCTLTLSSMYAVLTFGSILWSKIPHKPMVVKYAPKRISDYLERVLEGNIKIADICVYKKWHKYYSYRRYKVLKYHRCNSLSKPLVQGHQFSSCFDNAYSYDTSWKTKLSLKYCIFYPCGHLDTPFKLLLVCKISLYLPKVFNSYMSFKNDK